MYVGRKMTTDLITVNTDTPLIIARDLLREHIIKQLPVVDEQGSLVGILTDRDIKQAWASPATTLSIYELTYVLQKLTVESVMMKDVITISPDATVERAAKILHTRRIGSLPVVENDKLVGLIAPALVSESGNPFPFFIVYAQPGPEVRKIFIELILRRQLSNIK